MGKYVKKLTREEFLRDVINKELEPYDLKFEDLANLPKKPTDGSADEKTVYYEDWFQKCVFETFEDYIAWKEYYYEHFKLWQPQRRWKRVYLENSFGWDNLSFGLKYNYNFDEHVKKDKEIDMFKKVFGKKK